MPRSKDEELTRLLTEQSAYYRTLGADYLDQGLDLPGGDELAVAAFCVFLVTGG